VRIGETVGRQLPEAGAIDVLHEQRDLLVVRVVLPVAQETKRLPSGETSAASSQAVWREGEVVSRTGSPPSERGC
jgi:hypothetical protein